MNLTVKDICDHLAKDIVQLDKNLDFKQVVLGVKKLTPRVSELALEVIYLTTDSFLQEFSRNRFKNTGPILILVVVDDQAKIVKCQKICHQNNWLAIFCAAPVAEDDLLNEIQDLFLARQALIQRPAAMFNTIVRGRGVPYILEVAGELLENPVLLGDSNHRLIGASNFGVVDDLPWMEYRSTGFCTYEFTRKYQFEEFIEASVKANKAIIGDVNANFKYRRIFCTVVANQRVIGHLAVLESNRPFTPKDMEIAEFICEIIAGEMQDSQSTHASANLMANQLFSDLLSGNLNDETILEKRLANMRWQLPEKKYLMNVALNHFSESFSLLPLVKESLGPKIEFFESIVIQNSLLILLGLVDDGDLNQADFKEVTSHLLENNLKASLSHRFTMMGDFAKAYSQTKQALAWGQKGTKATTLYHYQDYAFDDLLLQVQDQIELRDFCHPALIKLEKYDQAHQSDLLGNLQVYILNMGNLLHSANALFIHRNTLSYRLNKIREITGLDLSDRIQFVNLFVSYKILAHLKDN